MKKFLLMLLAVLMLVSSAVLPMGAMTLEESGGITFDDNSKYQLSKQFEEIPVSFEAWVYVPKDMGRAGVVFGNYAGSPACVNFEVTTGGKPRLYVVEYTSGAKVIHDVTFNTDVRTGDFAHVAVVYDVAKETTYCYVNGVEKATKSGKLNITDEVCANAFMLGGDLRGGNAQYFKGAIESVALYSDARTAEEIKASISKVDTADENLIAYYSVDKIDGYTVKDNSGNGYDVFKKIKWMSEKAEVNDYAYSFCVVGDTQILAEKYPEKLADIYDWIIENKDEKKMEFVFGLGDITNKNTDAEWKAAQAQISKLNGVIPYSVIRGNHDTSAKLNEYFAKSDYMSAFNGFFEPGKIDNAWRTFSAGKTDYLLINLDFGPSDTLLNWAAELIESHPTHKVIITTHCYLYRDGTTLDSGDVAPPNKTGTNDGARNNGDQMWDKLVSKHKNIFLVLSGHDPSDDVVATQTVGDHGNLVTQILVDPQGVDNAVGATGMVAMLYFSNDGKTLTVEQYSTVRDEYYMNTSQFTIPLSEGAEDDSEGENETQQPPETFLPETDKTPDGGSIGIIGGADGPTAIFVAGQIWPIIAIGAVILLAIGFLAGFFVGKKFAK